MFGEVQRPQVCLLSCDMYIEKVYLGVPVNREVVLHNKSLLRAQFKWKEVSAETKVKGYLLSQFGLSGWLSSLSRSVKRIAHFTVVCLVAKPLNMSEARVDFVVIQTLLLFICKSLCYHAN